MQNRPPLTPQLNAQTFALYYYLKQELTDFCRANNLQTTGSKQQLTQRVAHYLRTGKPLYTKAGRQTAALPQTLTPDAVIESGFVCSQQHRAFFAQALGRGFRFTVPFQKWLKANAGKTYRDAINAYPAVVQAAKSGAATIDPQFEYNTYIRAFFAANKGKTLADAILCWKYKKSLPGHNRYQPADLQALQ
ncbi:MAG: DUF6434 domain-containing protein [Oscillospiraceae bacterium]